MRLPASRWWADSQHNAAGSQTGRNLMPLLIKRGLIQGFIVSDHPGREVDFLRDVSGWLKEGKIGHIRV